MVIEFIDVYSSLQNGGDGSAYNKWFLTEEEAVQDQDNMCEGWAEECIELVETFKGSNIHKEAMDNKED